MAVLSLYRLYFLPMATAGVQSLHHVSGDYVLNATVSFSNGISSAGSFSVIFDTDASSGLAEARYVFNITRSQPWLHLRRTDGAGKTAVFVPNGPLAQNISNFFRGKPLRIQLLRRGIFYLLYEETISCSNTDIPDANPTRKPVDIHISGHFVAQKRF